MRPGSRLARSTDGHRRPAGAGCAGGLRRRGHGRGCGRRAGAGGAPRAIPGAAVARRATDIASEALGGMLVRTIALDGAVPPVPRALAVACGVPVLRPPLALDVALVSAIGVGERSLRVADL